MEDSSHRRFSLTNPLNLMLSERVTRIARAKAALDVAEDLLGQLAKQKSRLLLEEDIREFDQKWGVLNSVHNMDERSKKSVLPTPDATLSHDHTATSVLNLTPAVLHGIADDIRTSNRLSVFWRDCISDFPPNQQGFVIMYTFMLDLLGRGSLAARIVGNKIDLDFPRVFKTQYWKSITAGFLIAIMNIFFVGYVLGKGQNREFSWHKGFVFTLLALWTLDLFVVHTVEVFLLNIAVPFIAYADATIAKTEIETVFAQIVDHSAKEILNVDVPSYLFVSKKLGKLFPSLVESRILSYYRPYLPGLASKRWRLVEWKPTKYYTWWDIYIVPILQVPPYVVKLIVWYGQTVLVMLLFNRVTTRMFFPLAGSALWLMFYSLRTNPGAATAVGVLLFVSVVANNIRRMWRLYKARIEVAAKAERNLQHSAFTNELLAVAGGTAAGQRERRRRLVVTAALQSNLASVSLAGRRRRLPSSDQAVAQHINSFGLEGKENSSPDLSSEDSSVSSTSDTGVLAIHETSTQVDKGKNIGAKRVRKVSILAVHWNREIDRLNEQLNTITVSIGALDATHKELEEKVTNIREECVTCQHRIVEWTSAFAAAHGRAPENSDKQAIVGLYVQYQHLKRQANTLSENLRAVESESTHQNAELARLRRQLQCIDGHCAAHYASVASAVSDLSGAVRWRVNLDSLLSEEHALLEQKVVLNAVVQAAEERVAACSTQRDVAKEELMAWNEEFERAHGRAPVNADKAVIKDKFVSFRELTLELKRCMQERDEQVVKLNRAQEREKVLKNELLMESSVVSTKSLANHADSDEAISFNEAKQLKSELDALEIDEAWLSELMEWCRKAVEAEHRAQELELSIGEKKETRSEQHSCDECESNEEGTELQLSVGCLQGELEESRRVLEQIEQEINRLVTADVDCANALSVLHVVIENATCGVVDSPVFSNRSAALPCLVTPALMIGNPVKFEDLLSSDLQIQGPSLRQSFDAFDGENAWSLAGCVSPGSPLGIYKGCGDIDIGSYVEGIQEDADSEYSSNDDEESERESSYVHSLQSLSSSEWSGSASVASLTSCALYDDKPPTLASPSAHIAMKGNTETERGRFVSSQSDELLKNSSLTALLSEVGCSPSSFLSEESIDDAIGLESRSSDTGGISGALKLGNLEELTGDYITAAAEAASLSSSSQSSSSQDDNSSTSDAAPEVLIREVDNDSESSESSLDTLLSMIEPKPAMNDSSLDISDVIAADSLAAGTVTSIPPIVVVASAPQMLGVEMAPADSPAAPAEEVEITANAPSYTFSPLEPAEARTIAIEDSPIYTSAVNSPEQPDDSDVVKGPLAPARTRQRSGESKKKTKLGRKRRAKSFTATSDDLCVVCLENKADYLVLPCGHQCGCWQCLQHIYASTRQCPICRLVMDQRPVKVYRSGAQGEAGASITASTSARHSYGRHSLRNFPTNANTQSGQGYPGEIPSGINRHISVTSSPFSSPERFPGRNVSFDIVTANSLDTYLSETRARMRARTLSSEIMRDILEQEAIDTSWLDFDFDSETVMDAPAAGESGAEGVASEAARDRAALPVVPPLASGEHT